MRCPIPGHWGRDGALVHLYWEHPPSWLFHYLLLAYCFWYPRVRGYSVPAIWIGRVGRRCHSLKLIQCLIWAGGCWHLFLRNALIFLHHLLVERKRKLDWPQNCCKGRKQEPAGVRWWQGVSGSELKYEVVLILMVLYLRWLLIELAAGFWAELWAPAHFHKWILLCLD